MEQKRIPEPPANWVVLAYSRIIAVSVACWLRTDIRYSELATPTSAIKASARITFGRLLRFGMQRLRITPRGLLWHARSDRLHIASVLPLNVRALRRGLSCPTSTAKSLAPWWRGDAGLDVIYGDELIARDAHDRACVFAP